MPAGTGRLSRRQKGSPGRQRDSSLLVSARQLQALVRRRYHWRFAIQLDKNETKYPPTMVTTAKGRDQVWSHGGPYPSVVIHVNTRRMIPIVTPTSPTFT